MLTKGSTEKAKANVLAQVQNSSQKMLILDQRI